MINRIDLDKIASLPCSNCGKENIRLAESADNVFRDVNSYNSIVRAEGIKILAYVCFRCGHLVAIWTEPLIDNEAIERDTLT